MLSTLREMSLVMDLVRQGREVAKWEYSFDSLFLQY